MVKKKIAIRLFSKIVQPCSQYVISIFRTVNIQLCQGKYSYHSMAPLTEVAFPGVSDLTFVKAKFNNFKDFKDLVQTLYVYTSDYMDYFYNIVMVPFAA